MVTVLKKELIEKENIILELRTEIELENRKRLNVADEGIQVNFLNDNKLLSEKQIQVKIIDEEDEKLYNKVTELTNRINELENELHQKDEEIEELLSKIKAMKLEKINNSGIVSNNMNSSTINGKLEEENCDLKLQIEKYVDIIKLKELQEQDKLLEEETNQNHENLTQNGNNEMLETIKKEMQNNEIFLKEYQKQNEKLSKENKELQQQLKKQKEELNEIKRKKSLEQDNERNNTIEQLYLKIKELQEQLYYEREDAERKEISLTERIETLIKIKEEMEDKLTSIDFKKLQYSEQHAKNIEERMKQAEKKYNDKMKELCDRLQHCQDIEDHYEEQERIIKQQDRQILNFKNHLKDLENHLFEYEELLKEKEKEIREMKRELNDMKYQSEMNNNEKREMMRLRERNRQLEESFEDLRLDFEMKMKVMKEENEKLKSENKQNIEEVSKNKKVEATQKEKELQERMKEMQEYYTKKLKELNETIKELRMKGGSKSTATLKRTPMKFTENPKANNTEENNNTVTNNNQLEVLRSEIRFKEDIIKQMQTKLNQLENEKLNNPNNNIETNNNNNCEIIEEEEVNDEKNVIIESEHLLEIRQLQNEKSELLRKLEVAEMNKNFIKENAMEQVKAVYSELNATKERCRQEVITLQEQYENKLKIQEERLMKEIIEYKQIVERLQTNNSPLLTAQLEQQLLLNNNINHNNNNNIENNNINETNRILQLKQLIAKIEQIESKYRIKEMEFERELNETKYQSELKIITLKQHYDLTLKQKNQQVLQLKSSLDQLVAQLQQLQQIHGIP
ncbi:hypothetical protein ABK040_012587 [Willaertia magna]